MSDVQQNLRVRLGPLASALIEGSSETRQEALEQAIQKLQEAADGSENTKAAPADSSTDLSALSRQISQQGELLSSLRLQVMKEMQMLRLLVASLMSDTNSGQQQLLAFATDAIEDLREHNGLLKEQELSNLESAEAAFTVAVRNQLQMGGDEIESDLEVEIER